MKNSRLLPLWLMLALVLLAVGCGNPNSKIKSYGNDGYLGMSNSNPNLYSNPNYNRYSNDTRMIHQALENVDGIHDATVRINGPYAMVTIYVDHFMDENERKRVHAEAYELVRNMVPRYHVSMQLRTRNFFSML